MRPTLLTGRLRLRPVVEADLADLAAMNADAEVMAYIGRPMTAEAVARELPGWIAGDGDFGLWTGERDGRFVGVWFLSRDAEDLAAGEIGWRLPRHTWGQGYALEGARGILAHAFDTLGLERVWAETMAVNTRSRRVMESLDMAFVRSYVGEWDEPIPGWEQGEVVYELTSSRQAPWPP